jgi:hypothetical protein
VTYQIGKSTQRLKVVTLVYLLDPLEFSFQTLAALDLVEYPAKTGEVINPIPLAAGVWVETFFGLDTLIFKYEQSPPDPLNPIFQRHLVERRSSSFDCAHLNSDATILALSDRPENSFEVPNFGVPF